MWGVHNFLKAVIKPETERKGRQMSGIHPSSSAGKRGTMKKSPRARSSLATGSVLLHPRPPLGRPSKEDLSSSFSELKVSLFRLSISGSYLHVAI